MHPRAWLSSYISVGYIAVKLSEWGLHLILLLGNTKGGKESPGKSGIFRIFASIFRTVTLMTVYSRSLRLPSRENLLWLMLAPSKTAHMNVRNPITDAKFSCVQTKRKVEHGNFPTSRGKTWIVYLCKRHLLKKLVFACEVQSLTYNRWFWGI